MNECCATCRNYVDQGTVGFCKMFHNTVLVPTRHKVRYISKTSLTRLHLVKMLKRRKIINDV